MKHLIRTLVLGLSLLCAHGAFASCTAQTVSAAGNFTQYNGSCANASEVLVTTSDVSQYDGFTIMSTTGSVIIYVSLDGTNYSTAALSLQDFGATVSDPVTATTALRVYQFLGKFRRVKVVQTGAVAAAATLLAWNL